MFSTSFGKSETYKNRAGRRLKLTPLLAADSMCSRVAKLSRARWLRNAAHQAARQAARIATKDRERAGSGAKHDARTSSPDQTPPLVIERPTNTAERLAPDPGTQIMPAQKDGVFPVDGTNEPTLVRTEPEDGEDARREAPTEKETSKLDVDKVISDCERYVQFILSEDYDAIRAELTSILVERDGGTAEGLDAMQERSLLNQDQDEIVFVSVLLHQSVISWI